MFELGPHETTEHPQWRLHTVTLICGPPGSGKTTLANELHANTLDIGEMPAGTPRERMRRFGRAAWRIGRAPNPDVAVIRGAPTEPERQHLQRLSRPARTIILTTPAALCHQRVAERNRPGIDELDVPGQHRAIDQWWHAYTTGTVKPRPRDTRGSPYNTARWRNTRRAVIAHAATCNTPCGLCGQAIDYRLPGSHPDGPTVDHITPTAHGGDMWAPANLQPAHRRCNSAQGAHITNRTLTASRRTPARTSREW